MKTGLFCNYENHHQDASRAIFEAENSFDLMGGSPVSLVRLKNTVSKYRQLNSSGADNFLLLKPTMKL